MLARALLKPVQIIPNHHKRLSEIVRDFGPKVNGGKDFLFPGYMFLGVGSEHKPPGWFWGMTGVVRPIRRMVGLDELRSSAREYERIKLAIVRGEKRVTLGVMEGAVLQLRDEDGVVFAQVRMFGRDLDMKVVAA